jgi:hypothetical protein
MGHHINALPLSNQIASMSKLCMVFGYERISPPLMSRVFGWATGGPGNRKHLQLHDRQPAGALNLKGAFSS